jgi:acyl-CoA reductase-like NAD-dependent aldehyde dehydrogenase
VGSPDTSLRAAARPGIFDDGSWRHGDLPREVRSPYDHSHVGVVSCASAAQVRPGRRGRVAGLSPSHRRTVLRSCADAFRSRRHAMAASVCAEIGMPIVDAEKEVDRAVRWLVLAAEAVHHLGGTSAVLANTDGDRLSLTTPQPVRRVLAITPYNRPLAQIIVKVAPAMLAGAPITLKPSEHACASAVLAVEILLDAGYPPEYLSLWTGDGAVAQALLTSGDHEFIAFTGSARTAQSVAAAAGPRASCYELGDVGALIVCADADLASAARAASQGAFGNAGQSCRGVKRILVASEAHDEFVERLTADATSLTVGDPTDRNTRIGTLINSAAVERLRAAVDGTVADGAQVRTGGRYAGATCWPIVISGVEPGARLVTEEFLAPVAPVVQLDDRSIPHLPSRFRGGLQVGIYTRDMQRFIALAERLPVGTVIANGGPQYDHPLAPFGGVGPSGHGRESVLGSARNMCFSKTIVLPPAGGVDR